MNPNFRDFIVHAFAALLVGAACASFSVKAHGEEKEFRAGDQFKRDPIITEGVMRTFRFKRNGDLACVPADVRDWKWENGRMVYHGDGSTDLCVDDRNRTVWRRA